MNYDKSNNPLDNMTQYGDGQPGNFQPQGSYTPTPAPGSAPGGSSKKKLMIVVAAAVIMLVLVGVVAIFSKPKKAANNTTGTATNTTNKSVSTDPVGGQNSPETNLTPAQRDDERSQDMTNVKGYLSYYLQRNSKYPTFDNMNSTQWVLANLPGYDLQNSRDPSGTSFKFLKTSAKGQYGYAPSTNSGDKCDNSTGKECSVYTLSYTGEDGEQTLIDSEL